MADAPDDATRQQRLLSPVTLVFLAVTMLLLPPLLSQSPKAAALLRVSPAAAAAAAAATAAATASVSSSPAAPAIALFGDSIESYMVSGWCRRHAPNFSLCFDAKVWTGLVHPVLPSDNCTGHQELLDTLADPWATHAGFMSCLPNPAAPPGAPSLVTFYNVWGALNRRPPGISPRPPSEMTLHEIWTLPFELVPRLLRGRRPNALLVQALFWDLLVEQNINPDYPALTDEGGPLLPAWVERYGRSAGELLDITTELTRDWPLVLCAWRTANKVNSSVYPGWPGWQQDANGLIRRANAAAAEAAAERNVDVLGILAEREVPLRDKHHPTEPVLVAAMDSIISDVAARQRA
jgi:hypothetical protein